jgi:hypothetical protein
VDVVRRHADCGVVRGNFVIPVGIAVAANGDLFVVDRACCGDVFEGGLIRVNPTDGTQSVMALVADP